MKRPEFALPGRSRMPGELGLLDPRVVEARTLERMGAARRFSLEVQDTGGFLQDVVTEEETRFVLGTPWSGGSVSLWLKWIGPTPAGGDGLLFSSDSVTSGPMGITWGPTIVSGLNFYIGQNNASQNRSIGPGLTSGVWYHVCGTWNPAGGGNTISGFLNADNTGWTNGTRTTAFSTATSYCFGVGPNFWRNGTNATAGQRIYGLQVWNRALTGAEVTALYNGGTPLQVMTPALLSGLRLWWRLGDSYQERQRMEERVQAQSPRAVVRDLSGNGFHGRAFSRHATGPSLPDFVADVP